MYTLFIVQHKMMFSTMLLLVVVTLLQTANIDACASGQSESTPITQNTTIYPKQGNILAYLNIKNQSLSSAFEMYKYHWNYIENFLLGLAKTRNPCFEECRCDVDCKREYCPNLFAKLDELARADGNELECQYPGLQPIRIYTRLLQGICPDSYYGYYFITECPPRYDLEERKACRRSGNTYVISEESEFSNVTPVTDIRSGLNYWNTFCASCHGIAKENLLSWNVSFTCYNNFLIYPPVKQRMIDAINKEECDITFQPPTLSEYTTKKCIPLISGCNQTGCRSQYDEVIERLCHPPLGSSYDYVYNNVFCMICYCHSLLYRAGTPSRPFTALLKLRSQEPDLPELTQCPPEMVFDPYLVKCRQLYCSPTKTLDKGKCVNIFSQIDGAFFETEITFFLLERCPVALAQEVAKKIDTWFQDLLHNWTYSKYTICKLDIKYEVNGIVKYDRDIMMDSQNLTLNVELISSMWKFEVHEFYDFDRVYDMIRNITNSAVSLQTNDNRNITFLPRLMRVFDIADLPEGSSPIRIGFAVYNYHSCSLPNATMFLNPCTMIELDEHIFNWSYTEYGVYVQKLNLSLNMTDFDVVNNFQGTVLRICTHVYMASRAVKGEAFQRDVSYEADAILSIVCTTVSLICLLLTLIVYIVFQELQTVPGKNNMLLVINLFMAQVMYIVFVFTPNSTGFICKCVGVLLHFFWLSAIFWMHICTFHMLKVFVLLNKPNSKTSISKTVIVYTVIVIVSSVIFVLINIVKALVESDMAEMGYGAEICYISSGMMVGFTFALPVGFVVVSNLVMFLVVIFKIRSLPSVAMDVKHNRNNAVILAKLSSLTGITWIFGFLYVLTEEIVLSYVFIVLNASVGIFIMASFILNKRVIDLIRSKFLRSSTGTIGSD